MKIDDDQYKKGFDDGLHQRDYSPPPCNKENHESIRDYNEGYEDGESKIFKQFKE